MEEAWMEIFASEIRDSNIIAAVKSARRYVKDDTVIYNDVAEEYSVTPGYVRSLMEEKNEPVAV